MVDDGYMLPVAASGDDGYDMLPVAANDGAPAGSWNTNPGSFAARSQQPLAYGGDEPVREENAYRVSYGEEPAKMEDIALR